MKAVRNVVVVVMGVLAFGAVAAAGASAHEFHSTVTGKGVVKALNTQTFVAGLGTVTCASASADGTVESGSHPSIELSLLYKECKYSAAFGIFKGNATVPLADYTVFAAPLVSVLKPILIDFEGELKACTVTIFEQSVGGTGTEIEFENKGSDVVQKNKVTKIHYSLLSKTGETCPETEEGTSGTYTGNLEAGVEGGTVEWK